MSRTLVHHTLTQENTYHVHSCTTPTHRHGHRHIYTHTLSYTVPTHRHGNTYTHTRTPDRTLFVSLFDV